MAKNEVRRTIIIRVSADVENVDEEGGTVTLVVEVNPMPLEFERMIGEVFPNFGWKIDKLLAMEALIASIIK